MAVRKPAVDAVICGFGATGVLVAEARLLDEEGEEVGRGTGTFMRSHIALSGLDGYAGTARAGQ